MKPKQWLKDNGFIEKVGQGRISAENKQRLRDAVAADSSLFIEGYSNATGPVASKPQATTTKPEPTGMVEYREPRRDDREWDAFTVVDGKRQSVGMRTVCDNCRSSLSYCHCTVSVVMIDHKRHGMVDFTPKSI